MQKSKSETILGIDPGLAITGFGVITGRNDKQIIKDCGAILTPSSAPFAERIETIYDEIIKLITRHRPTAVAIEELFFAKNAKTALKVGHARGVAVLAARHQRVPLYEFTPLQVKQALTGYGRASKSQMQKMVALTLRLQTIPQPDDVADALAVAVCCGQTNQDLHG